ncbi:MAG: hypothetical protein QXQ16_00055 [Candidatus Aenigmatarchaeota archaeon]
MKMKLQFSTYDAILASSILIIFFIVLHFSIPKIEFSKEKYFKFISYDILFAIDKIYKIDIKYENLKSIIYQILFINLSIFPDFLIADYGLWKSEINVSCVCDQEIILLLNNIYRNVEINGRNISINFFPTDFPLTKTDFERHGLLIFGCDERISDYLTDLKIYSSVNGILFICDINSTYFSRHQIALSSLFNLTIGNNNGNVNAILVKPPYGYSASYKAYKILKYQYGFSENVQLPLLNSNIVAAPNENSMYLFRQQNSNIAAITLTYFGKNIVGWSVNFYRDKYLDENEAKILLSLILSIVSHKEPVVLERYRTNLIPYVTFHYNKFLEPFILYFSIAS